MGSAVVAHQGTAVGSAVGSSGHLGTESLATSPPTASPLTSTLPCSQCHTVGGDVRAGPGCGPEHHHSWAAGGTPASEGLLQGWPEGCHWEQLSTRGHRGQHHGQQHRCGPVCAHAHVGVGARLGYERRGIVCSSCASNGSCDAWAGRTVGVQEWVCARACVCVSRRHSGAQVPPPTNSSLTCFLPCP